MSNFKTLLESILNKSHDVMISRPNNYEQFQKAMQSHSGKKVITHNGKEIWSGTGRATHPAETAIKNYFNVSGEPTSEHFSQISIQHHRDSQ
jgi:hypothetical protein